VKGANNRKVIWENAKHGGGDQRVVIKAIKVKNKGFPISPLLFSRYLLKARVEK